MISIGIDIGTARTRAGVCRAGHLELVRFPDGSHFVPSVVSLGSGHVRVGRSALARAATHPEQTVRAVKRLLGRTAGDPVIVRLQELGVLVAAETTSGGLLLRLGDEEHAPEAVAGALVRHVVEVIEQHTGERPAHAVLTTPYWFGPPQRRALGDAARLAGLSVRQILSEATSTALSLLDAASARRLVAIVDVGAGGCTASILEVEPRRVRLVASAGDPLAGGEDVDWSLVGALVDGVRARFGDFAPSLGIAELLRQTCEEAKHNLASMAAVRTFIPFLPVGDGIDQQEVTLERAVADGLMRDVIERVEAACRRALEGADVGKEALAAVHATGGTTRLPAVRAGIEAVFGPISSRRLDPDGSVALGAAYQAAMLDGVVESIPVIDIQTGGRTGRPPASVLPPSDAPPPLHASEPAPDIDEGAYRLELAGLLAALRAGALSDGGGRAPRHQVVRAAQIVYEEGEPSATELTLRVETLRLVLHDLGLVMQTARQYRWQHAQTRHHVEQALVRIAAAHHEAPHALRWDVGATQFTHAGQVVWKPDRAPYDRIPYELFAEGIRRLQIHPGITADELVQLLGVFLRDAALGFGVDDDAATALWDRKLSHVAYLAVDAFSDDDEPGFGDQRDELARRLARATGVSDEGEELLGAYVAAQRQTAEVTQSLALEEETRERLAHHLDPDAAFWRGRYASAFVAGWREAHQHGDLGDLLGALAVWTSEQLAAELLEPALELCVALLGAVDATSDRQAAGAARRLLVNAMFPDDRLAVACDLVIAAPDVPVAVTGGIALALGVLGHDGLVERAVELLAGSAPDDLRQALFAYVRRFVAGHAAEVGSLLATASLGEAQTLLADLRSAGSPAALAAMAHALESPHVEVRMDGLAALPDTPTDRMRDGVRSLVEEQEPALRRRALQVIGAHGIQAAGPVLVRRIQEEAFHGLAVDERKALLATVAVLNRHRAESIAIELLEQGGGVFRQEVVDETRSLAAEFLADSDSAEVLEALEKASKRKWFGSSAVRAAATRAAARVLARRGQRAPQQGRS